MSRKFNKWKDSKGKILGSNNTKKKHIQLAKNPHPDLHPKAYQKLSTLIHLMMISPMMKAQMKMIS